MPLISVSSAMTGSGVAAVVNPSAAITTAMTTVEDTSTVRNPNRLISGVVAGLIPTLPTKTNAATAPDFTGDQPNFVCHSSGSRNGTAPTTSQYSDPPSCETRNVSTRSVRKLSSGCAVRRRCQTAPASAAADPAANAVVAAADGAGSDSRWAA